MSRILGLAFGFLAVAPLWAQDAPLFPLAEGNRWDFRERRHLYVETMTVLQQAGSGFQVKGFPMAWKPFLWFEPQGGVLYALAGDSFNADAGIPLLSLSGREGEREVFDLRRRGAPNYPAYAVVVEKTAFSYRHEGWGRTFQGCTVFSFHRIDGRPGRNLTRLTLAPGVGPVAYEVVAGHSTLEYILERADISGRRIGTIRRSLLKKGADLSGARARRMALLIRTREDWEKFLRMHLPEATVREVDFERQTVLVAAAPAPTTGYGVHIQDVIRKSFTSDLTVKAERILPAGAEHREPSPTMPYEIVVLDGKYDRVRWTTWSTRR